MQEAEGLALLMPQEKNNKNAIIISWILVGICMGVIFYFSARPAVQSSQQSAFFVEWLTRLFGENEIFTFVVRKTAHFLEYAGLALLFNIALYYTYSKIKPVWAIIFTSVYAVTDEIHQIFVDGRSCQFVDWCIDTAGGVCGTIGFVTIFVIISKIIKNKIDTKVL